MRTPTHQQVRRTVAAMKRVAAVVLLALAASTGLSGCTLFEELSPSPPCGSITLACSIEAPSSSGRVRGEQIAGVEYSSASGSIPTPTSRAGSTVDSARFAQLAELLSADKLAGRDWAPPADKPRCPGSGTTSLTYRLVSGESYAVEVCGYGTECGTEFTDGIASLVDAWLQADAG